MQGGQGRRCEPELHLRPLGRVDVRWFDQLVQHAGHAGRVPDHQYGAHVVGERLSISMIDSLPAS